MRTVGIRELKNRLSEYLRLVQQGEDVLVTDRGRVIAELRQPGSAVSESPYPQLERAVLEGKARRGVPNSPDAYPRLEPVPGFDSLKALDELRGDR